MKWVYNFVAEKSIAFSTAAASYLARNARNILFVFALGLVTIGSAILHTSLGFLVPGSLMLLLLIASQFAGGRDA